MTCGRRLWCASAVTLLAIGSGVGATASAPVPETRPVVHRGISALRPSGRALRQLPLGAAPRALLAPLRAATTTWHPGPPVMIQVEMVEGEVILDLDGEQRVLGPWFGLEREWPLPFPLEEADRSILVDAATRTFRDRVAPLEIDGVPVQPTVRDVRSLDGPLSIFGDEHAFHVELVYPCEGFPEAVHVFWEYFPEDTRGGIPNVPFHAKSEGSFEYTILTERDPAYTFRSRADGPLALAPITVEVARGWGTLFVPVGVGAMLAAGAFLARRRRLAIGVFALGVAVGGFAFRKASQRPGVPDEAEGLALFQQLHQRVYAAFDATTESQVYDLLAASVDRSLLEGLYEGVRESLVFREEGAGAICQVEAVDYVELTWEGAVDGGDLSTFDVRADWRVDGRVIHFAHEHPRRMRYTGVIRVAHDGEAWRIAGIEVESQWRETYVPRDGEAGAPGHDDTPPGDDPEDSNLTNDDPVDGDGVVEETSEGGADRDRDSD